VLTSELDDVLDEVAVLRGRPREVALLPGGLTNHNYKVTTPDGAYVVRVCADDAGALAINRDHEHRNSVLAAQAGVGAPVVEYLPERHVLVIGYIDGETFTDASFDVAGNVARVAAACRQLHTGAAFVNGFDMFDTQRRYLGIVQHHGYRLPKRYLEHAPQVERIRAALDADPAPLVPCNNDLLAANFVDDGEKIWLIDYEYSGNNDACFELGNIWSECHLDDDQLDELVTTYCGRPRPSRVARAKLQGLMSRYGWTLWASIQAATSPIEFDFWTWGMEKYDAAERMFAGAEFGRLLDDVQRTD
jgi:thiamine kinase-like enzyme